MCPCLRLSFSAHFFTERGVIRAFLVPGFERSKDYERMVQSSETFIEVAMIRLILRRLARGL
jgi:hypothetical protein